jgi:hypothetical protein
LTKSFHIELKVAAGAEVDLELVAELDIEFAPGFDSAPAETSGPAPTEAGGEIAARSEFDPPSFAAISCAVEPLSGAPEYAAATAGAEPGPPGFPPLPYEPLAPVSPFVVVPPVP